MPDNLSLVFPGYPLLDDHQVLAVSGPDAVAFAHAQFSSDVQALADNHWQWSAWLTAKGRTIAVFQLIRRSPGELLLVLADGDADEIGSQLQRFVFRRKVRIGLRGDLRVTGAFSAPESAVGAALAVPADGTLELDMGNDALPRVMRLCPAPEGDADHDRSADARFREAWRQADLRFGLPRLDAQQREQWTPQQLGLDRLNGYSVKKGCYPGQEIVARTHFLGKAKRSLQLLQVAAATAGNTVEQDGNALGTVASVAGDLALAVLPLETSDMPLSVAGQPAQRMPLLDGLAR